MMAGAPQAGAGTLYGVGLGPGDPELVTLKAVRIIGRCPVYAHFRKRGRPGNARTIAAGFLPPAAAEEAFDYPVTTEEDFRGPEYARIIGAFYRESAAVLAAHLSAGRDVALLCEGDPFFYGSFIHMYERLAPEHPAVVIPGVTGMSGSWAAAARPITCGDDVLTVLPGTLDAGTLAARLAATDAAIIMKIGRDAEKVRAALAAAGRLDDAIYVECATMAGERVLPLAHLNGKAAPYFSLVLVPGGRGRKIV